MISSFQRNLIQVELRKRLDNWMDPAVKAQAYANLPVSPAPGFVTERDQDGYYLISDGLIAYCNLRNGLVFRIRKSFFDKDWVCYTELAAKGVETGAFRIDAPLYKEEIETQDGVWEYAELQSPGNNYGQNFNNDVFSWPELSQGLIPNASINDTVRNGVVAYFKEFVDQATVITHEAKLIAQKNGTGMPMDLCYIFNRYKDNTGYFWSDFDQQTWVQPLPVIVRDSLEKLGVALLFASTCGVLTTEQVTEINLYARDKWATI